MCFVTTILGMEGSYSFFKLITGFIKGALTAWKLTINKVIGKAQATGKRKIFHEVTPFRTSLPGKVGFKPLISSCFRRSTYSATGS